MGILDDAKDRKIQNGVEAAAQGEALYQQAYNGLVQALGETVEPVTSASGRSYKYERVINDPNREYFFLAWFLVENSCVLQIFNNGSELVVYLFWYTTVRIDYKTYPTTESQGLGYLSNFDRETLVRAVAQIPRTIDEANAICTINQVMPKF